MAATTPLAWHHLLHNRVRSGVAIAGVTFAIVLMLMQLGFLEAVKLAAALSCDALDFDLCLRSPDYHHFTDARLFPETRLLQARGARGVASASPLMTAIFTWRNPETGERRAIMAQGVEPDDPIFLTATQNHLSKLATPQSLLVDTTTRREFGPADGQGFGERDRGRRVEVNGRSLRIAGYYTRGAGLCAGGGMLLSRREFLRSLPGLPTDEVSLGLIRLEEGEEPVEVAQRLRAVLPSDVDIKTRAEVRAGELNFWVWGTNYGLIFYSGVVVAFVVGTAIVYQVLVSDVSSQMPEYATLKAMGYGNGYIVSVMLQQSIMLALISYVVGVVIAHALYAVTSTGAGIPVRMTLPNLALVLAAALAMCISSGLGAVRKAFVADPAELFR